MKKLILATLVASAFSTSAMAGGFDTETPTNNKPIPAAETSGWSLQEHANEKIAYSVTNGETSFNVKEDAKGNLTAWKDGKQIGTVEAGNGKFTFIDNDHKVYTSSLDADGNMEEVNTIGTDDKTGVVNRPVSSTMPNMPELIDVIERPVSDAASNWSIEDNNADAVTVSHAGENGLESFNIDKSTGVIRDEAGTVIGQAKLDKNGEAVLEFGEETYTVGLGSDGQLIHLDEKDGVVERPMAKPVMPTPVDNLLPNMPGQGTEPGDEVHTPADTINDKQSQSIEDNAAHNVVQDDWINNNSTAIDNNANAIDMNKAAIADNAFNIDKLFNEVDRLDERIDGSMASNQAALAARPYMSGSQTSAIGVGIGHTGDVQALAIGVAQRLDVNWTLNGNVAVTTASDSDVSVGVGTSYAW